MTCLLLLDMLTLPKVIKQENFSGNSLDKQKKMLYYMLWLAKANFFTCLWLALADRKVGIKGICMNLKNAEAGKEYTVQRIETDDEELDAFLFSLGCYSGEPITVISHLKGGCVVSIKDGRYNIDNQLAEAIIV